MISWFNNWVLRRANKIARDHNEQSGQVKVARAGLLTIGSNEVAVDDDSSRLQSRSDLSFRMYRAENGYVMEVRLYDKRTDRHGYNLHVIAQDEDLGKSISHIITLESLRT